MYERPQYAAPTAAVLSLLAGNPLALVVTATTDGAAPLATHAPVFFYQGPNGIDEATAAANEIPLAGSVLLGHMNIDNPQWRSMHDGDRALVVFQGPQGYISPTIYDVTPAAPTWDFTAVHLTGTLTPSADREEVLEVVCDTVRRLEAAFGMGWRHEPSLDYFRQIAGGVGAFQFRIESVQSMFKLSQEQPRELQRKVAEHFANSPSSMHRQLSKLMRACQPEDSCEAERSADD